MVKWKVGKVEVYRLVHEGSLHVLLQPLASVDIKHPEGEAKIPAGACYQKTLPNFNITIEGKVRGSQTMFTRARGCSMSYMKNPPLIILFTK